MISNLTQGNGYKASNEASSPAVPLNNFSKNTLNIVLSKDRQNVHRNRVVRHPQFTRLVNQKPMNVNYPKPSSCPNGFFDDISEPKNFYEQDVASDSFAEQDSEQDTDSYLSSGDGIEDELANEIKSRNEADDELASIFGSDDA